MRSFLLRAIIPIVLFTFSPQLYAAKTDLVFLNNGDRITGEVKGLERGKLEDLQVDGAEQSLDVIKSVFANTPGAARDIVIMNAGAAIYAADLVDSLEEGISKARDIIASGAAQTKLDELVNLSTSLS